MALRFFADQCVPNSVQKALTADGHDVFQLKDHLPVDAADPVVIAKAQELDALLLSLNGDFGDIVNYPPAHYKGIVALQVRNHPEVTAQIVDRLKEHLNAHPDAAYYAGKLLVVEAHQIRIRS